MSLFRTGLLFATLLLSACSMPIIDSLHSSKTDSLKQQTTPEQTTPEQTTPKQTVQEQTTSELDDLLIPNIKGKTEKPIGVIKNNSYKETLAQYNDQKALAEANYEELKNRTGKADSLPKLLINKETNEKKLDSFIQQLRSYTSKTNTSIAQLNARVTDRQDIAINGDLVRIFLPETIVTYKNREFHAQPLIGQWVRGEARTIRLKDNILFENPKSEDLTITFSETYQLIVNGQVIATVNPNKEKSSASFDVSTQDSSGKIVGKLDYRIENNK